MGIARYQIDMVVIRGDRFTLLDAMILVAGYAIAWSLPKVGILEVAWDVVVNGPEWWVRGWDHVLKVVTLGPTLVGPVIYVIRWGRRRRGWLPSGLELWCALGLIKWVQVIDFEIRWHLKVNSYIHQRLEYVWGAIVVISIAGWLGTRFRSSGWSDRVGLVLGVCWTVDSLNNFYTSTVGYRSTI